MSGTNNQNIIFPHEESITHYIPVVYKLNKKQVIKNNGVSCIGSYCMCYDKTKCMCLEKMTQHLKK